MCCSVIKRTGFSGNNFKSANTEATPSSLAQLRRPHPLCFHIHRGQTPFTVTTAEATPALLSYPQRPHLLYCYCYRGHTSGNVNATEVTPPWDSDRSYTFTRADSYRGKTPFKTLSAIDLHTFYTFTDMFIGHSFSFRLMHTCLCLENNMHWGHAFFLTLTCTEAMSPSWDWYARRPHLLETDRHRCDTPFIEETDRQHSNI